MKLVKILSVFAVIAAAGMVPVGCDSPSGGSNGYDEAASGSGRSGVGNTITVYKPENKAITAVTITGTAKVVETQTLTAEAKDADGATVTNARFTWKRADSRNGVYTDIEGASNGTCKLTAEDKGKYIKVEADNDVTEEPVLSGSVGPVEAAKTIIVKFEVLSIYGLRKSEGIVSTEDDGYLVYDHDTGDNDFTITIPVPENTKYLNIRWRCFDLSQSATYVKARMEAESGTVTFEHNGWNTGRPQIVTKNLDDVVVGGTYYGKDNFGNDWEDAKNRAVSN